MTIITVHGLSFGIESDGWHGRDADRDAAIDNLHDALEAMPQAALAKLHTALRSDNDDPDDALRLCDAACRPVLARWANLTHDRPSLSISAA